jgi:hypothetical protein
MESASTKLWLVSGEEIPLEDGTSNRCPIRMSITTACNMNYEQREIELNPVCITKI